MKNLTERLNEVLRASIVEDASTDAPGIAAALATTVEPTRKFIRKLEALEEIAAKILEEAENTDAMRKAGGVNVGMKRSNLSNVMKEWQSKLDELYGLFKAGREQMMMIAKENKIPTKRFGRKDQAPVKGPKAAPTKTDAIVDAKKMAGILGKRIRDIGELGSLSIRKAEEIAAATKRAKNPLSGDKLQEELGAWVSTYLDFRDSVSDALYGLAGGISRRVNAISTHLTGMLDADLKKSAKNFGKTESLDGLELIELPWNLDEDYHKWRNRNVLDEDYAYGLLEEEEAEAEIDDMKGSKVRPEYKVAVRDLSIALRKGSPVDSASALSDLLNRVTGEKIKVSYEDNRLVISFEDKRGVVFVGKRSSGSV